MDAEDNTTGAETMTMLIHGLLVDAIEDHGVQAYSVTDSSRRLGAVVKFHVGNRVNDRKRMYRSPWADHETLSSAVKDFLSVKGCRPRGLGGDVA